MSYRFNLLNYLKILEKTVCENLEYHNDSFLAVYAKTERI